MKNQLLILTFSWNADTCLFESSYGVDLDLYKFIDLKKVDGSFYAIFINKD